MFLRLIRITSVLQYMTILSDQTSYLTSFFTNIISSYTNNLTQQIEGTFQLLILWLNQHADTFINGNSLERALIICKSDQTQLSISINSLIDTFRQLTNCEQSLKLIYKLHSSCQTIVDETMSKLYRRIQMNTTNHFNTVLPQPPSEWRTDQQIPYMVIACDKLLKPVLSQSECLNIDKRIDIYDEILSSFIQAWISMLLERNYSFTNEMINFLQKDYEYLQTFLSTTICDQEIVLLLNKSAAFQHIAAIIDLLRTGEKNGSNSTLSQIPNQDKWLRSRKSSSQFLDFFQYACCCRRRNRVTTDPA